MKAGSDKVDARVSTLGADVNGWRVSAIFGNRAFFNGDWLRRAAAARVGIYGNDAEEAMGPMTRNAGDGSLLDGSKHKYTITFAKGQLPPVNAFWSITMYDGTTQFLVANPLDRYLINSPMLGDMKFDADGSLTIYVQKDSPGKDKESNWLPAPERPDLHGHAPVLAEDRAAVDPAARQGYLESAQGRRRGLIATQRDPRACRPRLSRCSSCGRSGAGDGNRTHVSRPACLNGSITYRRRRLRV